MRKQLFKRYSYLLIITVLISSLMFTIQHTFAVKDIGPSSAKKLDREFTIRGLAIGTSVQEVLKRLGQPWRIDQSEYGFDGQALTRIKKGTTVFNYQDSGQEYGMYLLDDVYATIFYDVHQRNMVTAILLIDEDTELSFKKFYGEPSKELRESFERQTFDLANAVRVRAGKKPFDWNDQLAQTARKHSSDMVTRDFFEHKNPDGKSPFDRMKEDGVVYKLASENIAAGQTSAIFAHESWMNSTGHRQNILGDFQHLGVGISFGGAFNIYYTQNFYQPHVES